MKNFIDQYWRDMDLAMKAVPAQEIARALNMLQAVYERDGRIYICGNGGSLALASHWVGDFNKTVFSHNLDHSIRRFQAIRLPSTEVELSAWANDIGYDKVFSGPLKNYLKENDCLICISSSGNSPNIIGVVEYAKSQHIPVIGLSGFDGGKLNVLSDAKIYVPTPKGNYAIVESVHGAILHLITQYFTNYFDHVMKRQ